MLQELKYNTISQTILTQEQAFRYAEQDSYAKIGGKFTAGTTVTSLAFLSALLELSISFFASLLTSPGYFLAPEKYARMTHHTADSARTAYEAARRTFGLKPQQIEIKDLTPTPKIEPSRVEKCKEFARAKLLSALQFGKDHQKGIIAASVSMLVVGAILWNLHEQILQLFARELPKQTPSATSNPMESTPISVNEEMCSFPENPFTVPNILQNPEIQVPDFTDATIKAPTSILKNNFEIEVCEFNPDSPLDSPWVQTVSSMKETASTILNKLSTFFEQKPAPNTPPAPRLCEFGGASCDFENAPNHWMPDIKNKTILPNEFSIQSTQPIGANLSSHSENQIAIWKEPAPLVEQPICKPIMIDPWKLVQDSLNKNKIT